MTPSSLVLLGMAGGVGLAGWNQLGSDSSDDGERTT